jgi:hypothetical protein
MGTNLRRGILSYITSDTFYTIGSKQTTRKLLQENKLMDLINSNSDTFDAAVSPAIFSLKKQKTETEYLFNYIDASGTKIEDYRGLITNQTQISSESNAEVQPIDIGSDIDAYSVSIELYRRTLRQAFFKPNPINKSIHDKHMSRITTLAESWEDAIRDSDTLEENLSKIKSEHLDDLTSGDISILGLMTIGGVGLQTGNNDKYLAYIEGSEAASEIKERNDDFEYNVQNETQYSYVSRVIKQNKTADPSNLSEEEKLNGIPEHNGECWVPIEKGFNKSDIFYKPKTTYINWSREAVQQLQNSSAARWQGYDYFFREGIFSSRGGFSELKVRYTNNSVIDSTGVLLSPTEKDIVSAKYLIGLLNSDLCEHITDTFINSSGKQATDMRHIPVPIPTEREEEKITKLVDEAIEVQKGKSSKSMSNIQENINKKVGILYDISL